MYPEDYRTQKTQEINTEAPTVDVFLVTKMSFYAGGISRLMSEKSQAAVED